MKLVRYQRTNLSKALQILVLQHIAMKYNPQKHNRRSIRLRGYDYSQAGLYFITICVQNRKCLFGNIADGKMNLNDAGYNRIANYINENPKKWNDDKFNPNNPD